MLRLLGVEATERLPPAFLVEAIELRELLDEAIGASQPDRVASIRADALERRESILARLAASFDAALSPGPSSKVALAAASESLAELRYVSRLIERCDGGDDDDAAEGAGP